MARDTYIQVRVSLIERKLWSRLAKEAGIPRTEWIRRAILLQTLKEQLESETKRGELR